ncbi:cytochrome P450 [Streptoalloteichus hindustanus]|uniref:cytochrome P450 n=1 Tax=Streptoalloteichus hindustanus TaxID=2017 RepID=UPI001F3855D6|nr:cytochrome P450 [Streptoalloteichus hindustanus]
MGDAELTQELLRDPEFHADKSGFFGDLLPTRASQIEVGHAVRNFLRSRLPRYRFTVAEAVAELPPVDQWPLAGNRLVYRCLAESLLHPDTPALARRLMNRAVHEGVVFRAPRLWQRARAELLRARLISALTKQVTQRRKHPVDQPLDVLDAALTACPDEVADRTVAELHLTLVRAIVVPVSTSLAWSVLLACLHHTADSPWPWPVDHIVREALRHRPMPWMLGRTVSRPTTVAGTSFRPGDLVSVSPYLLHHDEHHWTDPEVFRPERWENPNERGPYIPFGAGPFTCPGASVAHRMIAEALTTLSHDAHLTVTGADTRALMVEGIVPRPFTLHRMSRPRTNHDTARR